VKPDTQRLIDLVHAARDRGLYDDDPAWSEVDHLLRLHRPKVPLRGVSLPPDPGGPVGFTCPVCGAHEDHPIVSINARTVTVRTQIPLWFGGPMVDDPSAVPEVKVVDHVLTTTACGHVFLKSEWDFRWHRHDTSGRQWLAITPTAASQRPEGKR